MKNLFKTTIIAVIVAATGMLASCSKDDGGSSEPSISVSPETGVVQLCGGTVVTKITTKNTWTVTVGQGGEDITPAVTSGKGDYNLSFTVPEATQKRTVLVTIAASGTIAGIPVTRKAIFTIQQSDGGEPVYSEDCGETFKKDDYGGNWPYVDKYTGWRRTAGEGFDQAGVLYTGKSATVRNSGPAWDPVAGTDASGAPYVYISKSDNTFEIQKIAITADETKYILGFTAFDTYASLKESPFTPAYVAPPNNNLKLQVSVDGTRWGTVHFVAEQLAEGNGWYIASAPFTLPDKASQLYVRFSNFVADTTTPLPTDTYQYQASMRLDDFELCTGGDGPVVVWEDDPKPTSKTIAEVEAAGEGQYIVTGTVVATASTGFILGDATGAIYAYKKSHGLAIGDKVQISGSYTKYATSKCWEFNSPEVTAVTEAPAYTYNPAVKDGPAMDALFAEDATAQECQFAGVTEVGTYVNFSIDGATVKGGLTGVTASDYSQYNGQTLTVKGFLVGNTSNASGSFCNFIQYEVIADPTAPQLTVSPSTLSFEAAGGSLTVTATTNGLEGYELNAVSDNDAFTVAISGNTITVSTTATTTAQQGTLTVTYSNTVKTATRTVALKQKAPATGDEKTITMAYADIIKKTGTVELSTNGYGDMDVTNPETWYTWTSTADFTGCKICKGNGTATSTIYKYNAIQIQGNSSDTAKHGFIMNTSSLKKIVSIKITVKNSKDTNKPAYKIYFGTSQNPTTNEQTAKGATVSGSADPYYFTDEFAPTGTTEYGYFKLLNNSAYAVYLDTIEITYIDK